MSALTGRRRASAGVQTRSYDVPEALADMIRELRITNEEGEYKVEDPIKYFEPEEFDLFLDYCAGRRVTAEVREQVALLVRRMKQHLCHCLFYVTDMDAYAMVHAPYTRIWARLREAAVAAPDPEVDALLMVQTDYSHSMENGPTRAAVLSNPGGMPLFSALYSRRMFGGGNYEKTLTMEKMVIEMCSLAISETGGTFAHAVHAYMLLSYMRPDYALGKKGREALMDPARRMMTRTAFPDGLALWIAVTPNRYIDAFARMRPDPLVFLKEPAYPRFAASDLDYVHVSVEGSPATRVPRVALSAVPAADEIAGAIVVPAAQGFSPRCLDALVDAVINRDVDRGAAVSAKDALECLELSRYLGCDAATRDFDRRVFEVTRDAFEADRFGMEKRVEAVIESIDEADAGPTGTQMAHVAAASELVFGSTTRNTGGYVYNDEMGGPWRETLTAAVTRPWSEAVFKQVLEKFR